MTKENGLWHLKDLKEFVRETYNNWRNDRTLRLGAGLAYYVVFSITPIIALSVVVASFLFPREDVVAYLQEQAAVVFGANVSEVSAYIDQTAIPESISSGFTSLGLFGLGALVVTASFALLALQDSVNMIWGKPVKKGFHHTAKRYLFSYIMVFAIALMLMASLTVQAVVTAVESVLSFNGPVIEFLGSAFTSIATWSMMVIALAWLIKILTSNSRKNVGWFHALLGSAVTVVFMYIGVYAIGFYLTNFSLKSVTSAFGAVMLVLVWVYYESQILLAGFQLTKTMSERHDKPKK